MLEIRTGKGNMVLDTKTKIRFSYLFPLFVTDAIPNMVTYSFDLPDDTAGINASFLLASQFMDASKKYRKLYVTLVFSGEEFDSGVLICTGYSARKFRCTLLSTIFADGFAEFEMQNISGLLTPITLGDTTVEIIAEAKALSQKKYPSSDVCFPMIYAPDFYGDANTEFGKILNHYYDSHYTINEITKVWETGDPEVGDYETNENSLLPCYYVRSIIKQIFTSQGFVVKGNFFSNQVTKNIVMLSQKAADRADKFWTFDGDYTYYYDEGQLRILKFGTYSIGTGFNFDSSNGKVIDVSAKGYYDVIGENLKFQYVSGARNLSVNIFWSYISGTVNVMQIDVASPDDIITVDSIIGSFYIESEMQVGIFIACTQNYIPISGTINVLGSSKNTLNRFAKTISIGNSFSGLKISEMVDAIRSLFGLLIFSDKQRQIVEIDLAANVIINSRAIDITSLLISEPEKNYTDKTKYSINYDWDDEDLMTPLSNPVSKIIISNPFNMPAVRKNYVLKVLNLYRYLTPNKLDDGTYEWKDDVTFLKTKLTGGVTGQDYKIAAQTLVSHYYGSKIVMPYLPGSGKSDVFGTDDEIKLTVLSYHGFSSNDKNGNSYPSASIGNLNNAGVKLSGIQSLRIDDNQEDNLYIRALKPMLDLVGNHETITVDIQPNLDSIMRILSLFRPSTENETKPARKVIVQGAEMFVKQFDFEVTQNAITAVQLKLAKRNYDY